MTGENLITELARRRIWLNASDGRVRFKAPEGALDDALKNGLQEHKETLLAALRDSPGYSLLCPLSYNQLSMLFMHLLDPESAAYNLAFALRFRDGVDAARMRGSLSRLLRSHEQLRSVFTGISFGGAIMYCQLIGEAREPVFEEIDAGNIDEAGMLQRVQAFYCEPMDLTKGPVIRAALFRNGPRDAVLIVKLHHIISDGWSLSRIARDVSGFYRDGASETGQTGDANQGTYTEFALGQRQFLTSEEGFKQIQYWRGMHTPKSGPMELMQSALRPSVRHSVGATHRFEIDPGERAGLEGCSKALGVTPFSLLLAAFQAFLLHRSGTCEVVVGIPTLGQRIPKFENTVGYFVNPIPLKCMRTPPFSFRDHAQRTARELAEALDNRDVPFAAIVERVGGARDPSRTPIFQVLFNMLSKKTLGDAMDILFPARQDVSLDFGGMRAEPFPLDQQEGQFDLTLEFIDRGKDIVGLLKYCTDLFTANDAAAMVREFRGILNRIVSDPEGTARDGKTGEAASEAADQVVVAATFTAEPMKEILDFWFDRLGWRTSIAFNPFNRVFQALLDPSSLLRRIRSGYGVILVRFDDLAGPLPPAGSEAGSRELARRLASNLGELADVVAESASKLAVPICIVFCPSSPRLNELVPDEPEMRKSAADRLASLHGVHVLTWEAIAQTYPVPAFHEPLGEELGGIPYTRDFLTALATAIVRLLYAIGRKPLKGLVVDCDGTLWDGVAAEDGAEAVVIGDAQRKFQEFLVHQFHAGRIICLCSKNDEADVWSVFDGRPEMPLKREHISFWRINWRPKSENILELADEIGVEPGTLAFIDDNPFEREEVKANCPAVVCVELPKDWDDRVPFLNHLWPLDSAKITEEDRKRNEHYRAERFRKDLRSGSASFSSFLERLQLEVDIRPARPDEFDRLAQLSVRITQFNTTGRRMTAGEVARYAETRPCAAETVSVRDRFGDYGLVGGIFSSVSGPTLRIDSLLLSCRALGRGVEYTMVRKIAERAESEGCTHVEFPVNAIPRNEPARSFLEKLRGMCGGTDGGGTLRVAAAGLKEARSMPEEASEPIGRERPAVAVHRGETRTGDERILAIADTLRAIPSISAAVDERRIRTPGAIPRRKRGGAPDSELEKAIADAWKKALSLEEIGTGDNFFDLGGTSILLAQVALDLRKRDIGISIADLFRYPTISALAKHLGGAPEENLDRTVSQGERQRAALESKALPAAFERLKRHRGK